MRRRRVVRPRETDDGIVGGSRAILALRELIGRVAPTEATVLVVGERGTGKELVARALHAGSRRAARPFVAVNCAALPPELLAAELFGHERGAFTGALQQRAGLLAAAQGGTLFLDEIGDLSPEGQAMLLRFLQEGEVRPLGSDQIVRLDVRVLAATNRDLERAMGKGRFRADLYDRLSDFVLSVPPLRERREDLPLLIEHFLRLHARRHGLPVLAVSPGARRVLAGHRWPGTGEDDETRCHPRGDAAHRGQTPVAADRREEQSESGARRGLQTGCGGAHASRAGDHADRH
jgi:transcriptional regulator with GAF, ATPase, and Fis domain